MSEARRSHVPIAVVGVSALFPGSNDARGFWSDILAGRDLVTDVPPSHWLVQDYYDPNPSAPDKTYSKRGAFLSNVEFDPMEFGVPPSIVPATDSAQILALIVAQKVLEDASQGQFATMDRERMSILLGVTSGQELLGTMVSRLQRPVWLHALRASGIPEDEAQAICDRIAAQYVPWQESSFPGLLGNVVAGRIANRFDLRGTNAVTDAACASSLAALSMGVNELILGQSDLVIVGGVDTMNDIFMYMCFTKTPALSPTGDCRPFSDAADGTLLGEGLAMLALKRLDDAERDGDRVYALIRGVGSASDGRSKSVYAPLPEGQARALRRAYEVAGYGADTVELVEAHGTGTKAGDVAEFEGLRIAFDEFGRTDRQWCALGSVKSQIGHTKATAGAAGLFKAVMALHHKVLPPTIKVDRPNPKLEVDKSPFYLNTKTRPWIRDASHPRRASVSSFGFGGSNFHVALEEYVPTAGGHGKPAFQLRAAPSELVLLSGTSAEVGAACRALASSVTDVAGAARESQATFQPTAHARLAVVASNVDDLRIKLEQAAVTIAKSPDTAFSTPTGSQYAAGAPAAGGVAFVFPGQGSQYVGMGADVAMGFASARAAWDHAAGARFDGVALHEVTFPRPVFDDASRDAQTKTLTATEWAQPALGVSSLALLRVLASVGVRPDCVGGHSFGEVSALFAAGAIDEAGLLAIARRRGELMRDAAKIPGAMIAVSKPIADVEAWIAKSGTDVVVANHNGPTQVVLSGSVASIEAAEKSLADAGMTSKRLPVATAFHSPLVSPSSVPFLEFLRKVDVSAPSLDVIATFDAKPYPADAGAIRERLASQLAQPVRFVDQIEAMYARGVRTFVEVGAGSVLTDLVSRILGDRPHAAINLDRKGRNGVTTLQEALGRLSVGGRAVAYDALWTDVAPPSTKPVKKPAMVIPINGSNYGKPYPPAAGPSALLPPNPPRPAPVATAPVAAAVATPPARDIAPAPAHSHAAPVEHAPTPALDGGAQLAWVQAYQEAQRQTAEAHGAYQRAMADSHIAFLRASESSLAGLTAMVSGASVTMDAAPRLAPSPLQIAPAPAPRALPVALAPVAVAPPPVVVVAAAPPPAAAPAVAAPAAAPGVDLEALMLTIVAEKTGYPAEMLAPQMELEADLGIDSIKRVEILAAMRERAAGLGEVKPAELAKLRTLGQIVDHLRAQLGAAAPAAVVPTVSAVAAPAGGGVDLEKLMLTIVAEKTGYPAEMLAPQMELEADLGIDSIKRVEILAAMRERAPGLGEVKPAELAKLRTLGQIVDHLRAQLGASAASAPVAVPPSAPAAPGVDLEKLMLAIVAEKTGYPAEMLASHMELEADLGIDSIKRVEILAAMRERAPGLGEVKPAELAKLRTLGQIVDHLRSQLGGPAPAAPAVGAPAAQAPAPVQTVVIPRFATRAVAAARVGMALGGLSTTKKLVVTDDGTGIAQLVASGLAAVGVPASVVSSVPADADGVVFLGGLAPVDTIDAAIHVNRAAFDAAKAAAPTLSTEGGVFVTVQDTGGDFGLSGREGDRAWLAGVAALARTALREWPKAHVKVIDCERGSRSAQAVADAIVGELLTGGATLEVGLDASALRITLQSVATPTVPGSSPVARGGVVLVSGGARGVTAAAVVALAKAHGPRLVLLGRTPLEQEPAACVGATDEAALKRALLGEAQRAGRKVVPSEIGAQVSTILATREIQATLAAIAAAGAEARYLAVDVQDRVALGAALTAVREAWGPITGVVHAAGVLSDRLIAEKTKQQFDRVFDTKVDGLRALLDATANDPLTVLSAFSSVAARAGNAGQCDYAMANEVLNAVLAVEAAKRGAGCTVRSIGWGPWEGGMVTPSLEKHFRERGVTLIPLAVGSRRFVEEVDDHGPDVMTVIGADAGDGALGASTDARVALDVHVSARTHGYLGDHRIAGVPVVPVVLAAEWLVRAAYACRPDLVCTAVRDLKVLRGIKVDHFDTTGVWLSARARQISNGQGALLAVELRGPGDALHYSATIQMSQRATTARTPAEGDLGGASHPAVYGGSVLFHGPRFQVIQKLDGVTDAAAIATVARTTDVRWEGDGWRIDPAALDGALQLSLLWAARVLGGNTLPMAVGELRLHGTGSVDGPLRAVLRKRDVRESRCLSDVAMVDAQGSVVAELLCVETVLIPSSASVAAQPKA